MPGTTISRGNALFETIVYLTTVTWSTAALTSTTAELTTTVPGLVVGDLPYLMLVNSAMPANISYTNVRVSAANTLAATWAVTGTVTVPTGPWVIGVIRPEVTGTQLPRDVF